MSEVAKQTESRFFRSLPGGKVACILCPQACVLQEGEKGVCRVRQVEEGRLFLRNYGQVSAVALDPIEKKPLYHFYPGSLILSVGTIGCNLSCRFCQNWEIAHTDAETRYIPPEDLVHLGLRARERGSIGLAYTYSEPLVWYEYVLDTARLAKEEGLKNVLVTNGYINPGPLRELLPYIDAVNLDIKGWTDEFYHRHCSGRVRPVLETAKIMAEKTHLEVTNLLIPGENDREEEVKELVGFLAALNPAIPLHFSRYFPNYRMTLPPTPVSTLKRALGIAKERLYYVYLGNIGEENDTECPECGEVWVERTGFSARITGVRDGKCVRCGRKAEIVS